MESKKSYTLAIVLVVSLFFAWGVANSLNDILIPQFKKAFVLTDLQTGLVQSAFYGGYFLFAIPASLLMRRYGYRGALLTGLALYAVGAFLFYPAAETHSYLFFLGALVVIASGLSFLETSANPLMTVLGAPENAQRRLNFAQAFNPLGVLSGVMVGGLFIVSDQKLPAAQLAHAVVGPYLVIGSCVLLLAFILAKTPFPEVATLHSNEEEAASGGFLKLLLYPRFLFGVMAQFFYVAAQVGVWSFMIRYSQQALPSLSLSQAVNILFWSQVLFMLGRFLGTALMARIAPELLMAIYAAISVGLTAIAALVGGLPGIVCLAATSFFMSIMFPTIFAGAIRDLGPLTKNGSSFLVMAIIGGASAPPLMGYISGLSSMRYAMLVPCACFAVIFAFALANRPRATRLG
ncbi:MAG: L-fucose:H+ symporter permease [Rhizomicrobium sp.]|nr:L-fucose:H+ symporter permease [Rhizomicrobium sp.]